MSQLIPYPVNIKAFCYLVKRLEHVVYHSPPYDTERVELHLMCTYCFGLTFGHKINTQYLEIRKFWLNTVFQNGKYLIKVNWVHATTAWCVRRGRDSRRSLEMESTGSFFYRCPEHCNCRGTYRQRQAFYTIRLPCFEQR
jgi:hypothetical protein